MEKKKSLFREMASFTENGRFKSSFFVYAVCLSFLFIAIHVVMLSLLLEPIHSYFTGLATPLSGGWLNLFESGIPALLSAILCNVPFFFIRDKRLILAAYTLILLYVAFIAVTVLCVYKADARTTFMLFLQTVITAPLICGFTVSGGVYVITHRFGKNR